MKPKGKKRPMVSTGAKSNSAERDTGDKKRHVVQGGGNLITPGSGHKTINPPKPSPTRGGTVGNSNQEPQFANQPKLLGTDSTGRFLEVPQIVPIWVQGDNEVVPFSIELNDPDKKTISFIIPRGTQRMLINGWYAIPVYVADTNEVENGYRRLVVINPDQQHEIGWDLMEAGPPVAPPAIPYTFRPGFQAGCLLQYGWEVGNYPVGAFHHGHMAHHYRIFPVPMELPEGAQGRLTIVREPNTDKWFEFFPDTPIYLLVGLIGRRVMESPPPFQISANTEPTSERAYTESVFSVPNTLQAGQLGRSIDIPIKLTCNYPAQMDELVVTGELDGVWMQCEWVNGNLGLDWFPSMLFHFLRAGGRNISPLFVETPTEVKFTFAQGIRLAPQEDEKEAQIAVDIAGGIFGW